MTASLAGWSRVVADVDEARAALGDPGDALDLRAAVALDGAWAELGFEQLAPGELVRPVEVPLADLAATRELGARLAGELGAGDLVVLSGPLGAGKTSLTQGIGAALGVRGSVTSPTFVLARTHRGPLPLTHVDAYRLLEAGAGGLDLVDLDLEAALEEGVVVVEWGAGVVEQLVDAHLHVTLGRPSGALDGGTTPGPVESRIAGVRAHGERWRAVQRP